MIACVSSELFESVPWYEGVSVSSQIQGRADAREIVPIVYRELRRLAAKYVSRETPGHTIQPTALINETFIRLNQGAEIQYKSNTHFVAIAARAMREILVDHARKRRALKAGHQESDARRMHGRWRRS